MKDMIAEVEGLVFEHSQVGLARQLTHRSGIEGVDVNSRAGTARIHYNQGRITPDDIRRLIAECGYQYLGELVPAG
jgi:hypothetical protein